MMEYVYYTDLHSMFQALAAGVVMGIYYDIYRLLRRVIPFARASVAMQDLLFWVTSAVFLFFVCVRLNNGYIRIYFVVFSLIGWIIYFATAGRIVFAILDFIMKYIFRVCSFAKNRIKGNFAKIYNRIK